MGFSRQESGVGCHSFLQGSSRDLPDPGIEPWPHTLQADSLPSELGKPTCMRYLDSQIQRQNVEQLLSGAGGRGNGESLLNTHRVSVWPNEKNSAQWCVCTQCHWTIHLKIIKMVNFMLYAFHQNFKNHILKKKKGPLWGLILLVNWLSYCIPVVWSNTRLDVAVMMSFRSD